MKATLDNPTEIADYKIERRDPVERHFLAFEASLGAAVICAC
jgi:hypothetical protein